jgi:hypothetical protein
MDCQSEFSMTARHIVTRIEKLEISRRSGDEMLLLWREPDQKVDTVVLTAKSAGLFGPGDRVLCAEWFGDAKPKPRWIRRIKSDVTESEMDSLIRNAVNLAAGDVDSESSRSLTDYSDGQLWYGMLGVET